MTDKQLTDINFPVLDLRNSAADQIMNSLRWAIMQMELLPGQALPETEVAQRFGASRTPVRSALTQLRGQGLVITLPSRGNYVTKLSEAGVRSAHFIRESLELGFARKLCERGLTEPEKAFFKQNLAQQKLAVKDMSVDFLLLDEEFHNAIASFSGLDYAHNLYLQEKANLNRLRQMGMLSTEHRSQLYQDHHEIFASICDQDSGRVDGLLRNHIQDILSKLSFLIAENRTYFED
ncbi:MAG: GntR family transcriptional regulator [Lentilitoribacter sp.]